MWNGKIVYYNEGAKECNTWCWKDESHIGVTINKNQHSYDEKTGICANCNEFNDCGITYTLNDDGNSYRVSAYDSSSEIVKIYAEYKGKPVTSIDAYVFYNATGNWDGNKVIKELYLPTTINQMPSVKACSNLEVLSMPGVTKVTTTELARKCENLKTVIIGETFSCGVTFVNRDNTQNYDLTIYTTATSDENISINKSDNDMWNGKIVYFDSNLSVENTWRWSANGVGIEVYGE